MLASYPEYADQVLLSGWIKGEEKLTRKAAAEMRERAQSLVGGRAAKKLLISTFHSLGVRLLREDGELMGLKQQFSILDSDDVLGVLRDAGATTDAKQSRCWQWSISLWKNQGLNAAQAAAQVATDDEVVAARVMALYEERLNAYQAVDFDDLIRLPLELLQRHDSARLKWQERLRHVLVDEYQDTNRLQATLLRARDYANGQSHREVSLEQQHRCALRIRVQEGALPFLQFVNRRVHERRLRIRRARIAIASGGLDQRGGW